MIVLGIDIGGTGIKGAPVDIETGQLAAERFRIPTPQPSTPLAVADVVKRTAEHFNYVGPTGITFPGVVKNGVIYTAANLDSSWVEMDGRALFSDSLGAPVEVVNDADAAGVAEMQFGAAKGHKGVVIMLTFGTGIGSAVFVDGKLVPNTELGHLKIRGKDAERRASERVRETKDLTWSEWAKRVSELLSELERLFSPDLFVLGGGVSKKAEKFLPYLLKRTQVELIPAETQNAAGILGAAYVARGLAGST